MYKTVISFFIFMLGIYYIFNTVPTEAFKSDIVNVTKGSTKYNCPDVLVQEGNTFYLHNTKAAPVPGINPVTFKSLEDYIEFLDWQRSQNINCPVLYIRESYDTQGHQTYNVHPSPTDLQGGLNKERMVQSTDENKRDFTKLIDAARNDGPYNADMYPSFDSENMYIGVETPLDKMYHDSSKISPNPMDPNWGGREHTQGLINTGHYKDSNVLEFKSGIIGEDVEMEGRAAADVAIKDRWGSSNK